MYKGQERAFESFVEMDSVRDFESQMEEQQLNAGFQDANEKYEGGK